MLMLVMMDVEPDQRAAELPEAVRRALRESGYGDLHALSVSAHNGHVRLQGRVRSFYLKQKAQTVAMSVTGVSRLENELVVL